jgi:signal transduction histidine kinase
MTPEVLSRLWNPLFTTKAKGMGFGLAICKRIIEAHSGTIAAESAVEEGTVITVTYRLNSQHHRRTHDVPQQLNCMAVSVC